MTKSSESSIVIGVELLSEVTVHSFKIYSL
jgi:hypothetical protein